MRLGVLKEPEGEDRVAIVPKSLRKLGKAGFEIVIESGAGIAANHLDADYAESGATVGSRSDVLGAPLLISIHLPDVADLHSGQVVACVADPFRTPERFRRA